MVGICLLCKRFKPNKATHKGTKAAIGSIKNKRAARYREQDSDDDESRDGSSAGVDIRVGPIENE
jgi:hypothetical protein